MANETEIEIYIKTEGETQFSDEETLQDVNKETVDDYKPKHMSNEIKIEGGQIKSEVVDPISLHNVKQEPQDVQSNEPEKYVPCSIKVENLPVLPSCDSEGEDQVEGTDDSGCSHDNPNSLKGAKMPLNNAKEQNGEGISKRRKRKTRNANQTRLLGREKARRYRERIKSNPEKAAEHLRKKREIYHKTKKLVSSMKPQEQEEAREIWKCKKKAQRLKKESVSNYASWLTLQSCNMKPFIW